VKEEYNHKKTWMFWCVWEGYKLSNIEFNNEGLDDYEDITYSEYRKRIIKIKNET
jgi:hypothetical protein